LYTALFICLPRVYFGDHYPTDILAGACVAIGVSSVFLQRKIRNLVAKWPMQIFKSKPEIFYVFAYIGSLLLTTNFEIIRKAGALVFHGLRTHSGIHSMN
jgi:undecaprenyl-diphosphatase